MEEYRVEKTTEWCAKFFELNADFPFTLFDLYTIYSRSFGFTNDTPMSEKEFANVFKNEIMVSLREEYFPNKFFINTDEGWVLTTKHDIIMEVIKFLEGRG